LAVKKYPKIVQADARGQIVIPKDLRSALGIDEGTGFYMYSIGQDGILLKRIPAAELSDHKELLDEIKDKASLIGIKKDNIDDAVKRYRKTKDGRLEVL
jgi:AbrB family looped-hinge helix DNA binding protein